MRWVTIALAGLLLLVQADLWLGRGSLPQVWKLQRELAAQKQSNERARERNVRVTAEVTDLKEGLEMVEDKARSELGMLKPDEVLVQVSKRR
ncbi:MAG: septum formation initiator family protein [Betaproteobacteria bacterium]|jgi:cell division protein FtsB